MAIDLTNVGPSYWGDMRKNHGSSIAAGSDDFEVGGPDHVGDLVREQAAVTLTISGTPVTTGTSGTAYTGFTATAAGGVKPYTYALVGTWPTGLSVSSTTGAVSGTPSESGTFATLSVKVTDDAGATAQLDTFTITVAA